MAKLTSYATVSTLLEAMFFYTAIDSDVDGTYESRKVTLASIRAALNATNGTMHKLSKGADVASANALTLGNDGNSFDITGTTSITSITTKQVGAVVVLQFDGILTLTHHSTDLILPSGANIVTAAGDIAVFYEYATGDWRCIAYTRANGRPLFSDAKGADVASATALALGIDGNSFDVTGTVTITSINTLKVGTIVVLQFDGKLTLTHHATDLILPNGTNIITAAGDIGVFYEYATGDWRCISYQRATGIAPVIRPAAMDAVTDTAACSVANYFTTLTTTGAAVPTLADGVEGQLKKIQMIARVGNAVLTPANLRNGTTITFGAVGDVAEMMFTRGEWEAIALYNVTGGAVAPVLA